MSLISTPAILLRSYPYSETSQILRFYTEDLGAVSALARGTRKSGGRHGGSLSTFASGILTLYVREHRELQTFKDFAPSMVRRSLGRDPLRLSAAAILGEVVLQHAESERHPSLYVALEEGLDGVEAAPRTDLTRQLLVNLWRIVGELGYAPLVDECVACGRSFRDDETGHFDFAAGGLRCPACLGDVRGPRLGPKARIQLNGLLRGELEGELLRPGAHLRLVSDFVTYHVSGGTPLRSMGVLWTLLGKRDA